MPIPGCKLLSFLPWTNAGSVGRKGLLSSIRKRVFTSSGEEVKTMFTLLAEIRYNIMIF